MTCQYCLEKKTPTVLKPSVAVAALIVFGVIHFLNEFLCELSPARKPRAANPTFKKIYKVYEIVGDTGRQQIF